ncbi:metallophosphoesterase [Thalassotalea crassostreae]|uniref:metallophosphoesterase n=1 Tax=Thalassotalea crassostreae TaxID=1763536 RepID=UPI000838EA33|nr:metallophosphoesterase [Thalassotalea crassostreae]
MKNLVSIHLLICCFCIGIADAKTDFSATYKTSNKVIAIGDIHGAYAEFHALLKKLELINENDDWIGGDTYLVSLGDLLDRGADSRKVMDLLIKLQQQALTSGGMVLQVLGNHELMVTTGDLRYVSKEEFSAFIGDETKQQRTALEAQYRANYPDLSDEELAVKFVQQYPPGYSGFVAAFSPNGQYGKWLRLARPVIKVNDSIFVHGGLSSTLQDKDLNEINKIMEPVWEYQDLVATLQAKGILALTTDFWTRVEYLNKAIKPYIVKNKSSSKNKIPDWYNDLVRLYELQNSFAFSDESPMWYRGNVYCHPYSESFNTERILKRLDAKRIVVGHTPLYKEVKSRLSGQVILADTGMLKKVYKGNATAIIFDGDEIKIQTTESNSFEPIVSEENQFSVGSNSMTDEEIKSFLLTAEVIKSKPIGVGVTNSNVVTLSKDGKQIRALFKTYDSDPGMDKGRYPNKKYIADRYQFEIAAFRLDRMLDLNLVPVAVRRRVDGKYGLLQYWVDDLISETKIEEKGIAFESHCPKLEQYITRYIFDVLIYNDDRNQTNLNFSRKDFMLYLIDHSIAFGVSSKPPDMYKNAKLKLSSLFREKLSDLSYENLHKELNDLLSNSQISAIIKRRDFILSNATTP